MTHAPPPSDLMERLTGRMLYDLHVPLYREHMGDETGWAYLRDEAKAVWDGLAAKLREREDRLLHQENVVALLSDTEAAPR